MADSVLADLKICLNQTSGVVGTRPLAFSKDLHPSTPAVPHLANKVRNKRAKFHRLTNHTDCLLSQSVGWCIEIWFAGTLPGLLLPLATPASADIPTVHLWDNGQISGCAHMCPSRASTWTIAMTELLLGFSLFLWYLDSQFSGRIQLGTACNGGSNICSNGG